MQNNNHPLVIHIREILTTWKKAGLPARASLHETADALSKWKIEQRISGLWDNPPLMIGVTLDDAWGHGIQLILKFADVMGLKTHFIGTLQSWENIVLACKELSPDFLGLTVLQLDTEDDLIQLRRHLLPNIRIIAGGPVFQIDPELSGRVGIDWVAKDAGAFLRLLLKIAPLNPHPLTNDTL